MDLQLNNKTALVTGSTSGIGFAITELLAQEGSTVIIHGSSAEGVQKSIQKINSNNPSAKLIAGAADLSCKSEIDALIRLIPKVDILVNNAGIYEVRPFADISDDEWLHIFNVNVMSGIRLSRHYLKPMLKQNWGRILFISSESGLQIPKEMIHYGMTKAAQLAVARGIAEATAGTNITVNSVLPGPTSSEGVLEFVKNLAKEQNKSSEQIEKEFFETVRPSSLLKRFTKPEEVAKMVTFLCSPLSSATNGASVRVDGGVVRSIG